VERLSAALRAVERAGQPWTGLLLVGTVLGLFSGPVVGSYWILASGGAWDAEILGWPMIVLSILLAAHLVPGRRPALGDR